MSSVLRENWLIQRSLDCLDNGKKHEARSWILTAKSLYPNDFAVQHEVLRMQLAAEQLEDAAALLSSLLEKFWSASTLWILLERMVTAVASKSTDGEGGTLAALFHKLTAEQQQSIILECAKNAKANTVHHCQLLLLLMRLHPDTIKSCAKGAVETLMSEVSSSSSATSHNSSWKLLVLDLLPFLLNSGRIAVEGLSSSISDKDLVVSCTTLQQWLDKALYYHVSSATAATAHLAPFSPPMHGRRFSVDVGGVRCDPWSSSWQLLAATARLCDWSAVLQSGVLSSQKSVTERAQLLQGILVSAPSTGCAMAGPPPPGIFYAVFLTWLEACWGYTSACHPLEAAHTSSTGQSTEIVLVELPPRSTPTPVVVEGPPPAKRRMPDVSSHRQKASATSAIQLSLHPCLVGTYSGVINNFQAALQTWQLIKSLHDLHSKYDRVLAGWPRDRWDWVSAFESDISIYKADYSVLIQKVQKKKQSLASSVQLVSALFCSGEVRAACKKAIALLEQLGLSGYDDMASLALSPSRSPSTDSDLSLQGRRLQLIPCCDSAVAPVAVRMLIGYYENALKPSSTDRMLGHLLVLLQHDWPLHETLFSHVVEIIRDHQLFSYPKFFNYITNIEILEEFAFLAKENCKLELLPQAAHTSRRTITRGVNKGAKEELRQAIEKQVACCLVNGTPSNFLSILREFLQKEGDILDVVK